MLHFCAVSGSPVRPSDYNRYRLTLSKVGGGYATGYMHYCCWPCVCDTQDFIRVDTRNVTTVQGRVKQQQFAVIGNPCQRPEKLHEPFVQPFGRGQTTLAQTAQEVRCLPGGVLDGATLSDHGHVIIGIFFDADTEPGTGVVPSALDALSHPVPGRISTSHSTGVVFQDEREWQEKCEDRALHGYNSGMGEIFRQVCAIAPIPLEALKPPLTLEDELSMNIDESKNDSCIPDLGNNAGNGLKDLDSDATNSDQMES